MRGIKDRILDQLPTVKMPTLGKTVDIPVYIIHNSADPEDYFFIFDFEQFVERSRSGMFVRPKLIAWAGRSDFARRRFARQFRESFAAEFEAARQALADSKKPSSGWFGVGFGAELLAQTIPGVIAIMVLSAAFSVGSVIWSALPKRPRLPSLRKTQSETEKLESTIEDTKAKVDQAIAGMEVTIHPDLRRHAMKDVQGRQSQRPDDDVWPLPEFVTRELVRQSMPKSTSWW